MPSYADVTTGRRWAWGGSVLVAVAIGAAIASRDAIGTMLLIWSLAPGHAFGDVPAPAAPDYGDRQQWAALPDRDDAADAMVAGGADRQADAPVDVFFIHPTTYLSSDAWNQSLDDAATNELTDSFVMRGQASVFNLCCRIYAPRYRQATLYAFVDEAGSGERALDLAYGDVARAFRHFIAHFNAGRPFIVAAHSQGSRHADRLLAEIAGTTLADRLVAAYPVGFGLDRGNRVPVCETATQTGCQVTWNTVGPAPATRLAGPDDICVNPLTWRTDGGHAPHDRNPGAVSFDAGGTPEPGAADAVCRDGNLLVSEVRSDHYAARPFGRDNYHLYDYALFYLSIQANAAARVDAFLRDADRRARATP